MAGPLNCRTIEDHVFMASSNGMLTMSFCTKGQELKYEHTKAKGIHSTLKHPSGLEGKSSSRFAKCWRPLL